VTHLPHPWGAIPTTWQLKRNRFIFKERNERAFADLPLGAVSQRFGVVEKRALEALEGRKLSAENDDLSNYKRICSGDVVYNKMRMWQGAVGVSSIEAIVSPAYVVATPTSEVDSRFIGYLLKSEPYVFQSGLLSYGICEDQNSLRWEEFANLRSPIPPLPEQQRIANFLDEQTARIDALIAEKELLRATLAEWRAAEMTRICFGGTQADKSTGNQWIPVLPKHWRLARLKHLIVGIEQGWSPECEAREADDAEWGVLKAGATNGGVFRESEHKALPAHLDPVPELEVRAGDVIISRASGSVDLVGSFAYVYATRPHLMLSDKNFRLKFSQEPPVQPELVAWVCNTPALREQVRQHVSGAEGLAKNIGIGSLRELWLPVAPIDEQPRIIVELKRVSERLFALEQHLIEHINRLREYRSSLISAAVNGQLDVSAYQLQAAEELLAT
jgi:type I restriction enzyme S subunit